MLSAIRNADRVTAGSAMPWVEKRTVFHSLLKVIVVS
jgi:hypothetical protein